MLFCANFATENIVQIVLNRSPAPTNDENSSNQAHIQGEG